MILHPLGDFPQNMQATHKPEPSWPETQRRAPPCCHWPALSICHWWHSYSATCASRPGRLGREPQCTGVWVLIAGPWLENHPALTHPIAVAPHMQALCRMLGDGPAPSRGSKACEYPRGIMQPCQPKPGGVGDNSRPIAEQCLAPDTRSTAELCRDLGQYGTGGFTLEGTLPDSWSNPDALAALESL